MNDDHDVDQGYGSPYANYLEEQLKEIEKLVMKLLVDHMRTMPPGELDPTFAAIDKWLGDDWHTDLSGDDEKIVATHQGWYLPEWGPGPWNPSGQP
jgi:hypothetical protein